jgi:LPXTG-motif cell wall-anchored protein
MLSEGEIPTGQINPQGNQNQYLLILIAVSAATIAGITLILVRKKRKHEETATQPQLLPP